MTGNMDLISWRAQSARSWLWMMLVSFAASLMYFVGAGLLASDGSIPLACLFLLCGVGMAAMARACASRRAFHLHNIDRIQRGEEPLPQP